MNEERQADRQTGRYRELDSHTHTHTHTLALAYTHGHAFTYNETHARL